LNLLSNSMERPLDSERVNPFHMEQMIQEQNEANKKEIIFSFIENFYAVHQELPELDTIQDIYSELDLDDDMINHYLKEF
jgi:hypothetical protein